MSTFQLADYLAYPATFIPAEEGGFTVIIHHSNDENEGWITEGDNFENAKKWALYCIRDAVTSDAGRQLIPRSVPPQEGDIMISVPPDFALKIMLRNAMFEAGVKVSDIAHAKGVRAQAIFKVIDFKRASKLSSLMPLFEVIGRPLKISC